MKEQIISFKTVEEIKEFVGAACNCPFDIDVVSGRITIDAKSILGMLSGRKNFVSSMKHRMKNLILLCRNMRLDNASATFTKSEKCVSL